MDPRNIIATLEVFIKTSYTNDLVLNKLIRHIVTNEDKLLFIPYDVKVMWTLELSRGTFKNTDNLDFLIEKTKEIIPHSDMNIVIDIINDRL